MQELTPLLLEASKLLIVGMVFVFVFLTMLTLVIQVLAKLAPPAHIAAGTAKRATKRHTGTTNQNKLNPSVVAAISAAVTQYRTQAEKT